MVFVVVVPIGASSNDKQRKVLQAGHDHVALDAIDGTRALICPLDVVVIMLIVSRPRRRPSRRRRHDQLVAAATSGATSR